jgi:TRAP-type mannitol/chloroaromatic compound transport system substrate-binding protein
LSAFQKSEKQMKRAISAALALSVIGVLGIANAQPQPQVLKIQSTWTASMTFQGHLRYLADRVDKLTGGTVRIEPLAAGQVVPPFEVADATHKRVIDGHHAATYYWIGKNRAAGLFSGAPGGPFGMDAVDYIGWMYEGGGEELLREFYQDVLKLNAMPFAGGPAAPQPLGWFRKPVRSLADFKGMKCRQTGLAAEMFAKLGQTVVNLPAGEIAAAAQRGVIDCVELAGGISDLQVGLPQLFKYHYTPSLHEVSTMGEVVINLDVWKSLTLAQQEAIRSAIKDANTTWGAKWQRQNADAMAEFVEKHGVQILRTPPDILTAMLKVWDEIVREESVKNPFFAKVVESQRAYAAKVVPAKRHLTPPYSFTANYYWPDQRATPAQK